MAEPGDPLKSETEHDTSGAQASGAQASDAETSGAETSGAEAETTLPAETPPSEAEAPASVAPPIVPPASTAHDDHDDLIGFSSVSSLAGTACPPGWGRPVQPALQPGPVEAEPEPDLFDPVPERPQNRVAALRETTFSEPEASHAEPHIEPERHVPEAPAHAAPVASRTSAPPTSETAEGEMGLFAVYALLLGAVPTLGASALVALVAVTVRPRPEQALARSHFDFQKRTLWIAAVAAVIGAVLIAVNIGVPALFILAVWTLVRGAWGLMKLARGEAIRNPKQWLIAAK
jgi:uncharacterized membrane protein